MLVTSKSRAQATACACISHKHCTDIQMVIGGWIKIHIIKESTGRFFELNGSDSFWLVSVEGRAPGILSKGVVCVHACMHVCVCLIVPNLTCNMERRDIPQQECGCSSATSATSSGEEKLVRFIAEVKGWAAWVCCLTWRTLRQGYNYRLFEQS